MPADVFFTPFDSAGGTDSLNRRVAAIVGGAGFFESLEPGAKVAVKVHPGERNNVTYLRPSIAASMARLAKGSGASPFVTETTTLYCRERFTPGELLATAAFNGFSEETMGCPVVVGDGTAEVVVPVGGKHLREVGVAGEIAAADALVVLTHVTCHDWTAGLAGSLKQLGMGCVGRKTKAEVHLATSLAIDLERCNACGTCVETCKSGAVVLGDDGAVLTEACVRCGVCIGFCPEQAITYRHDYGRFAEGLAEAAAGVVSAFEPGRVLFLNYMLDVTRHCDCEDFSALPVFGDIGVAISRDPVAVDSACGDMLNAASPAPGSSADCPEIALAADKIFALTSIDWRRQLEHAASVGAGTTTYRLAGP